MKMQERFIARTSRDAEEFLTPQTPFGMTGEGQAASGMTGSGWPGLLWYWHYCRLVCCTRKKYRGCRCRSKRLSITRTATWA
ncbi:MAG TPA: hypothetical protein VGI13_15610 [Candidatus Acidoferrum sp.]